MPLIDCSESLGGGKHSWCSSVLLNILGNGKSGSESDPDRDYKREKSKGCLVKITKINCSYNLPACMSHSYAAS